jgi:hypothetical protein
MEASPTFDASKLSSDLLLSSTSSTFQTNMKNNFDNQTCSKKQQDGVAEDTNDCLSYNNPSHRKCVTSHNSLMGHKETLDTDSVSIKNSEFSKYPYYHNRETAYKPTTNLFLGENDTTLTAANDLSTQTKNIVLNDTNAKTLNKGNDALQKVNFILILIFKNFFKRTYKYLCFSVFNQSISNASLYLAPTSKYKVFK